MSSYISRIRSTILFVKMELALAAPLNIFAYFYEIDPELLHVIVTETDLDFPVERFFSVQEPIALFPLEEDFFEVKLHFVLLIEDECEVFVQVADVPV